MVVYGPKDDDLHEVVGVDIQNGFLFHRALVHAMLTYRDYDGYFWIGDDVYINYPMVSQNCIRVYVCVCVCFFRACVCFWAWVWVWGWVVGGSSFIDPIASV